MKDQAHTLRKIFEGNSGPASPQVLSVTSGKGGVGKTSIVVNMAIILAAKGKKVLVLGLGDTGLACARWLAARGARVSVADSRAVPPHGFFLILFTLKMLSG